MTPVPRLHLRLLDSHLELGAGDHRVLEAVELLWRPFRVDETGGPVHRIEVRTTDSGLIAGCGERETFPAPEIWTFLDELRHMMLELALEEASGIVDVHAAVAVKQGRALLVAGPSGAGKTTLALSLLDLGWTYFGDDLAVVDRDTGVIRPFPTPLGVRRPVEWRAENLLWEPPLWMGVPAGDRLLMPAPGDAAGLDETASAAWLVFLERSGTPSLLDLTPAEAIQRAGAHSRHLDPEGLRTLARMCGTVTSLLISGPDPGAAYSLLKRRLPIS